MTRGRARRPGRARRAACAALAALALPAAPGCARYAPAAPAAVPEGARVRVAFTAAGTASLARTPLGPGVVGVEGTWAGASGDSARVRADRILTSAGVPVEWSGAAAPVAFARADVQTLERRSTDRGRTALVVGGAVAAGVAFLALVRSAGRDGGGGAGGGGGTPF